MSRISAVLILASLSLLLLATTLHLSVSAAVGSAYVDSKNQFSISPPSGWTVDSSGAFGTAVILYGPTDSGFRINMNVLVQATSMSLSDYVAASKSSLSTGLTNYQLVSETAITIGGVAADELVNTFTQGSYNIKDQQDILVQNGKAYVITSTGLTSNFATYQPSFAESVQTFAVSAPVFPWLILTVGVVVVIALVVVVVVFFVRRMNRANVPPEMQQPMMSPPPPPPPSQP